VARVEFNGEPGETFTNNTDKVLYQFIVNWVNSCGVCIQMDHAVGPSFPIPLHRSCRCKQIMIEPGAESRPFVDFRAKLDALDPSQRSKVVGKASLELIDAGVVKWEDVVTGQRVRDLREVAALKRLSVEDMIKAGVGRRTAEQAHESVHTPAHELARKTRQEMIDRLTAKGVQKEDLKRALGERLAARVGIGQGPSGPGRLPVEPTTPKPPPETKTKRKARTTVDLPETVRADYLKKARVKEDVAEATARAEAKALAEAKAADDARRASLLAKKAADDLAAKKAAAGGAIDRDAILAATAGKSGRDKFNAIAEMLRSRSSAPTSGSFHGMTDREPFVAVEFEGVRYHFDPATVAGPTTPGQPYPAIAVMFRDLAEMHGPIRPEIAAHTKDVYLTTQANRDDHLWKVRYNNPDHVSAATGGGGTVVVYNGRPLDVGSLAHEMGHNWAEGVYGRAGSTTPPLASGYRRAMASGEPPVSEYARNNASEDFAESVRLFTTTPGEMKRIAPLRYAAIEELLRGHT
jgi:hypothetical protein